MLIPTPFLFHYIEISFANGATFAFTGTFLFVILAGILSMKSKLYFIVIANIFSIFVSILLGIAFIIPPNQSWFNPFGMNFAIIFTGIIILIGLLIVRFVLNSILLKVGK